jgi:hypothetical protein
MLLRGEIDDQGGIFFGRAKPARGNELEELVLFFFRTACQVVLELRRQDAAGGDRVDLDVCAGHLHRHRFGEGDDRPFGRRVMRLCAVSPETPEIEAMLMIRP